MLHITIPGGEMWDEVNEVLIITDAQEIDLEHSLVSLKNWESKWHKPFLHTTKLTYEETLDYIRCMTLTPNVDPSVYNRLTNDILDQIYSYINAPMTATTLSEEKPRKSNREIITAELIYYWMVSLTIPFECQYWHLNQLVTLIKVCGIKNAPPKKRSKRDIMSSYAQLNAANRKRFNSKG